MTNPLKGEVEVKLGKETYPCRLTIESLIKIETELDSGILQLTQKIANAEMKVSELSVVLHYALRGGGKDINLKDVYSIIQTAGIMDASIAVANLLSLTLSDPNADEDEKKKDEKQEKVA
tara:strand:+ start:311 stop:670 length:360 start_codon:yes stop_codon:yes gene_type:complete